MMTIELLISLESNIYRNYINSLVIKRLSTNEINDRLITLYLLFMSHQQTDLDSEKERIEYNLPLEVYNGGKLEIDVMSKLFNINIYIIEELGDTLSINNIDYHNGDDLNTIFLKKTDNHYDIAIPL